MRIEPRPSEPVPNPTRPAATAAAVPPLDPPGVRATSQGLRVTPKASLSVQGQIVSSGTWVLPITIAPASRSRRTISLSAAAGCLITAVPKHVGSPATSWSSLIATGTPYSGRPSRSPSASASARARSAKTTRNALSRGFRCSMRSRHASTSSRGETSPAATISAWRATPAKTRSAASTAAKTIVPARAAPARDRRLAGRASMKQLHPPMSLHTRALLFGQLATMDKAGLPIDLALMKLQLPETGEVHRRVLAVLAFLDAH